MSHTKRDSESNAGKCIRKIIINEYANTTGSLSIKTAKDENLRYEDNACTLEASWINLLSIRHKNVYFRKTTQYP